MLIGGDGRTESLCKGRKLCTGGNVALGVRPVSTKGRRD